MKKPTEPVTTYPLVEKVDFTKTPKEKEELKQMKKAFKQQNKKK